MATFLPPLSVAALQFADDLYRIDYANLRPVEGDWHGRFPAGETTLPQPVPHHLRVTHPLFAAVYYLFPPPPEQPEEPAYRSARRLLVTSLAALEAPETDQEAAAYYQDGLALRSCLQVLADAGRLGDLPANPELADLVRLLDDWSEAVRIEEELERKIRRLRNLVAGRRYLATRQFHQPNRGSDSRLPRRELTRTTPATAQTAQKRKGPMRGEGEGSKGGSEQVANAGRTYQRKAGPRKKGSRSEPADPDSPDEVERLAPSALTPGDDWLVVRRTGGMPPAAAVFAPTDPAILPGPLLVQALDALSEVDEAVWILAWLVTTTGMAVPRIEALEVAQGNEVPDWNPQWYPERQRLRFRLRDGPARAEGTVEGRNSVVDLPLPGAIQRSFEAESACQPLAKTSKRLRPALKTAFRHSFGPSPRLGQLRASAWGWKRPHARDAVAAALLSGQFGAGLAAQAAYRRIQQAEIEALFHQINSELARYVADSPEAGPALKKRVTEITFPAGSGDGAVGSDRSRPFGVFECALAEIREAFHIAVGQLRAARGDFDARAQAVQRLINAQGLHAYLGWLLATAARPVGPKTVFQPLDWGWFLADKASPRYQEVRLLPPVKSVQEQQALAERTRGRALRDLGKWGWKVRDQRPPEQLALPALLAKGRGRTLLVKAVHHADFEAWMGEFGLTAVMPTPANATRHTMATYLRGRLPQSLVDAFLGHHGHGADRLGPASSVPLTAWEPLETLLLHALAEAGFTPLSDETVWV